MATVDELLSKQKDRLEKMSSSIPGAPPAIRKKTKRTGPARPWQENLPQYQNQETSKDSPEAAPKALAQREQTVSNESPKALAQREQTVSATTPPP